MGLKLQKFRSLLNRNFIQTLFRYSGSRVFFGLLLLIAWSPQVRFQTPVPVHSPSAAESKALLKEFKKTQKIEFQALLHRQKFEVRELKASQDARFKEWKLKEQSDRHSFFANHEGKERREYIRNFMLRRDTLLAMFAQERKERIKEHDVRRQATRKEQVEKLKLFEDSIRRGERPPETLWPSAGSL